jgi:hypothetical protein
MSCWAQKVPTSEVRSTRITTWLLSLTSEDENV